MDESEEHHEGNKNDKSRKLAEKAQKAANLGNIKELYNTTRLLANKPIKDKHRHPLVNAIDQLRRWREYFRELFQNEIMDGVDQPTDDEDEYVTDHSRISSNPPSKLEIMQAIIIIIICQPS
ncbi:hypothetical protein HHI36_017964 [Cryptolaemus montrouzieri]|uniref:Uncharacterized protein n=1 Tax=Cryptolaemus montrouzieri TaxID=559131 RepID=A0ABD2NYY6_9CUCU